MAAEFAPRLTIMVQVGPEKRDCEGFQLVDGKVIASTVALRWLVGATGREAYDRCTLERGWKCRVL